MVKILWQIAAIHKVFLPIFTVSITLHMQVVSIRQIFFHQTSYNPYLHAKLFHCQSVLLYSISFMNAYLNIACQFTEF